MLQVIFGDDEHTAADGPYNRLLKTRKWIYINSIVLFAVGGGLYQEQKANDLVKVIQLPAEVIRLSALVVLSYLVLQFCLLIVQLIATYDIVLSERFVFRRADDLTSARERVKEARKMERAAYDAFRSNSDNALAEYKERLELEIASLNESWNQEVKLRDEASKNDSRSQIAKELRHSVYRFNARIALAEERMRELSTNRVVAFGRLDPLQDENVKAAREDLALAQNAFAELQSLVPSERPLYRTMERLIDLFRVLPPLIVAAAAIFKTA